MPRTVLTIQSTVAMGHVGSAAAQLPLQRLGCEVWTVDTVSFSNHPGHGRHTGRIVPAGEVASLLAGIEAIGGFDRVDAVLSGYLGEAETAQVVADAVTRINRANPAMIYLCDPVMGDFFEGKGRLFVAPDIPDAIRRWLLPLADIITPNRFEADLLGGFDAARAVITGVEGVDTPVDAIDTLIHEGGHRWRVRTPKLARRFDGAGDCFSALLLGHYLRTPDLPEAVGAALSSLYPILQATGNGRDLALVAAQDEMLMPRRKFFPEEI